MPNSDKNIVVTPNRNLSGLPDISLTGFGNSTVSIRVPDSSTGTVDFVGAGGTVFSIDTNVSSSNLLLVSDSDGIPIISGDSDLLSLGLKSGQVVINGDGLKLPVFETVSLPPGKPGMLVYDRTVGCPRYFDGTRWELVYPEADFGPGRGFSFEQGADARNFTEFTNNDMLQYTFNTDNQGAGNASTKLSYKSGCPGSSQFCYHTGHQETWWPAYHAIRVTTSTKGKVLNQIQWQTHVNAVGNVDMFGTNYDITASNFTNDFLYTHLGRIHFGGSGGGTSDCTVYTRSFNPNNWGYKWYMIKMVDNNTSLLPYPQIGSRSGWAMYRLRLNKV